MRIIYNNRDEEVLEVLVQKEGTVTIHRKTINHLNPAYIRNLFTKNLVEYDFRTMKLCELPPARSQMFGTYSLKYKGILL